MVMYDEVRIELRQADGQLVSHFSVTIVYLTVSSALLNTETVQEAGNGRTRKGNNRHAYAGT